MDNLGVALRDLADHLDVRDDPSLAPRVVAQLNARGVRAPVAARRRRRALLAAAALVAGGATVAAGPAVADWLRARIGGVEVRREPTTTRSTPDPAPGAELDLGRHTTLAEARRQAPFPVRTLAGAGAPEVWLDDVDGITVVSLVYPDVLLQQFAAPAAERAAMTKYVRPGTAVEEVEVDGAPGLWVAGPHVVALRAGSDVHLVRPRLAGHTLVWEAGSVTYRLESSSTRMTEGEAVALAETLE